jgi:hypothetical protein
MDLQRTLFKSAQTKSLTADMCASIILIERSLANISITHSCDATNHDSQRVMV